MILSFYSHRLPHNYDISLMRTRAKQVGPQYDHVPGMHLKGFLLREAGRGGATSSSYSGLYVWRNEDALRDFFVGERFKSVVSSFGRPEVYIRLALDARRGKATSPRFAYVQELLVPVDTDLHAAYEREIARSRDLAGQSGTVVSAVGVDVRDWKFTRVLYSEKELPESDVGTRYEVLYFARPEFDAIS
jgi:hypothetical protein